MIRLGLCCKFDCEPIRFRTTTATAMRKLPAKQRLDRIATLCLHNADALTQSITFCANNGIGAFRINSQVLPLKTHPDVGYHTDELPAAKEIRAAFRVAGALAARLDIRLSFHPDQFIVLSSVDPGITQRSTAELIYQAEVAEWVGADVINIHGGGAYGEPEAALVRVHNNITALPDNVRALLTLENDDRVYSPLQLLPVCLRTGVPLVFDVHHHRVNPDPLTSGEITRAALQTWDREPLFHISSPINGWEGTTPSRHHDFIDPLDLPDHWRTRDITLDVEAKAKERAVIALRKHLLSQGWPLWGTPE